MKRSKMSKIMLMSLALITTSLSYGQNNALHFKETPNPSGSNYVNLNSLSPIIKSNSTAFTVEFQFERLAGPYTQANGMLFAINHATNENLLLVGIDDDNFLTLSKTGGGISTQGSDTVSVGCHTIAITVSGTTVKVYVDGKLFLTDTGGEGGNFNLNQDVRVSLGQEWDYGNTSQHVQGVFDNFKFYNYTMTAVQVSSSNSSPNYSIPQQGLLVYYDFDQGNAGGINLTETTLYNRVTGGASLNGVLVNFLLTGNTSNFVPGNCAVIEYCCKNKANLLWNGDQTMPNNNTDPIPSHTGFTSDYSFNGSLNSPGTIAQVSNSGASAINPNWILSDPFTCLDINYTDRFIVVNGRSQQLPNTRAKIFSLGVSGLQVGKEHTFCMKAKELESCLVDIGTHPRIAVNIVGGTWTNGGSYMGNPETIVTSNYPCDWQSIFGKFTALVPNVIVEIYLYEDIQGDVNDIAIDNIAVQACFLQELDPIDPPLEGGELPLPVVGEENNGLLVYPNPFTDAVKVELKEEGSVSYRLLNLQGLVIREGNSGSHSFEVDLKSVSDKVVILEVNQNNFVTRKVLYRD